MFEIVSEKVKDNIQITTSNLVLFHKPHRHKINKKSQKSERTGCKASTCLNNSGMVYTIYCKKVLGLCQKMYTKVNKTKKTQNHNVLSVLKMTI